MYGYLSQSAGLWRVIVQGLPICNDKQTREEAIAAAEQMHVRLGVAEWNGDNGFWQTADGAYIPKGKIFYETGEWK